VRPAGRQEARFLHVRLEGRASSPAPQLPAAPPAC
jgi:hypothetical protein